MLLKTLENNFSEFSNKTEILWKIQSVASVKHKNQNKRSSLFDVQSDYSVTNQ